MSKIRMLNKEYDLSQDDDYEIANIMEKLCSDYQMCRNEISTATLDVWDRIEHVSEEILRRKEEGWV